MLIIKTVKILINHFKKMTIFLLKMNLNKSLNKYNNFSQLIFYSLLTNIIKCLKRKEKMGKII